MSPEMPALLVEMGIKYDPERLKTVLSTKWPQVYTARGVADALCMPPHTMASVWQANTCDNAWRLCTHQHTAPPSANTWSPMRQP